MNDVVKLIEEELKAISDPEKAAGMKGYMKDNFEFLGVASPERKVIVRFIWQEHKEAILQNWRKLYNYLWKCKGREYQYVAMDLMGKTKRKLEIQDIDLIEMFVVEKSWWDTVDFIASHMAGMYFEKFPEQIPNIIPVWINSDNMWLNRTAILFQLKYNGETDFNLLKENILHHIGSKEFFINKACGWALRQYSKFDSEAVKEFIENTDGLANLTIKEGSKYL